MEYSTSRSRPAWQVAFVLCLSTCESGTGDLPSVHPTAAALEEAAIPVPDPGDISDDPAAWQLIQPSPFAHLPHRGIPFELSYVQDGATRLAVMVARDPQFRVDVMQFGSVLIEAGEQVVITAPADAFVGGAVYYWRGVAERGEDVVLSPIRAFAIDAGRLHAGVTLASQWMFAQGSVAADATPVLIVPHRVQSGFAISPRHEITFSDGAPWNAQFSATTCFGGGCGVDTVGEAMEVFDYSMTGQAVAVTDQAVEVSGMILQGPHQRLDIELRRRSLLALHEEGETPITLEGEFLDVTHSVPVMMAWVESGAFHASIVLLQEHCTSDIDSCTFELQWAQPNDLLNPVRSFSPPAYWLPDTDHTLTIVSDGLRRRSTVFFDGVGLSPEVPFFHEPSGYPEAIRIATGYGADALLHQSRTFFTRFSVSDMSDVSSYVSPPIAFADGPLGKEGWGHVEFVGSASDDAHIGVSIEYLNGSTWSPVAAALVPAIDDAVSGGQIDLGSLEPDTYGLLRFVVTFERSNSEAAVAYVSRINVEWRGECLHVADGEVCDQDNLCSQSVCQAGVCVEQALVACPSPGQCEAIACDPATGLCESSPANVGHSCDPGDLCTTDATCTEAGQCSGTLVVCEITEPCVDAAACNPLTGQCEPHPSPDGTVCEDGLHCTENTQCLSGKCVGDLVDCRSAAGSDPCLVGVCTEGGEGPVCVAEFAPEGHYCPDDDFCNGIELCDGAGNCSIPGEPMNCEPPAGLALRINATETTVGQSLSLAVQVVDAAGADTVGAEEFCLEIAPLGGGRPQVSYALERANIYGTFPAGTGPFCMETYGPTGGMDIIVHDTTPEEVVVTLLQPGSGVQDAAVLAFWPGQPARLRLTSMSDVLPACHAGPVMVELLDALGNRALLGSDETESIFVRLLADEAMGAEIVGTTLQTASELPADTLAVTMQHDFGIVQVRANSGGAMTLRGESASLAVVEAQAPINVTEGSVSSQGSSLKAESGSLVAGQSTVMLWAHVVDYCGNPSSGAAIEWRTDRGALHDLMDGEEGSFSARLRVTPEHCGGPATVQAFVGETQVGEDVLVDVVCPQRMGETQARGCAAGAPGKVGWLGLLLWWHAWRRRRIRL